MTSRRGFPGDHNMYGARSGRPGVEGLPHLNLVPRRQSVYSGDDSNRMGRGKSAVDEDGRLGSSRSELRASSFLGGGGKSRGSVEHTDHRSDLASPYATISSERRGPFRDDGMLKIARGTSDDAPLRGEGGGGSRFRDSSNTRGDRAALRSAAAYADEPKWMRNGNFDGPNYEGGGSLRDSDYLSAAKPSSSSSVAVLPGFIVECSKRTIADFSSQKGIFVLPFDDRRLAEQVGPGTKIFLMDVSGRELHGVFQAESYAMDVDPSSLRASEGTAVRVRVRVAKECIPLTERQFKDIIQETYYSNSKLTDGLTKEQVMKLLQTFRPADAGRNVHLLLPSSRRTVDSGLPQSSSQDFHSISDENVYRKEERWRRGAVESRSLSSHAYHSAQDVGRLSSKLPVQTHSKGLDEYEVYGEDEVIENIPLGSSRLVASSNLYSNSRSKQPHSLRSSLPGSRTGITQAVGNAGLHNDLKLADGDWREEIDPRDVVIRKRRPLSSSSLDIDLKRGDRSSSPTWKDVTSSRVETLDDIYERPGKGGYKEELPYLSSGRRRRDDDIDFNIPLDIGHGEPLHVQDMESKLSRRKVWGDEDDKRYSVSPPSKGRFLLPPRTSSLRLSDHLLSSNLVDGYEDSRLDSRHMLNLSRKDFELLRSEEKGRPAVSSSYLNGRFGKLPARAVVPVAKSFLKDKSVLSPAIRKRPLSAARDVMYYGKESTSRGSKLPAFKIKANLQAPGRGKPERVVTMVNSSQSRLDGILEKDGFSLWKTADSDEYVSNGRDISGQGRKRKPSVWSRITLPAGRGLGQKGPISQGRGRVFTRLGPSPRTTPFKPGEESFAFKKRKLRPHQTDMDADLDRFENFDGSPDALEGEDYLNDELEASQASDKETEKAADDLQGWTRKKASVLAASNSGDESGHPDHGDYGNGKGGRRKLVRPSIGAKGHADDSGWKKRLESSSAAVNVTVKTSSQPRRRSDSMDMEVANLEIQEAEVDFALGSRQDLNSPAEEDHLDMMSS